MADLRDLLDDDDLNLPEEGSEKTASDGSEGHLKIAEQLEALSTDDLLVDDIIKVAIWEEIIEDLKKNGGGKNEQ